MLFKSSWALRSDPGQPSPYTHYGTWRWKKSSRELPTLQLPFPLALGSQLYACYLNVWGIVSPISGKGSLIWGSQTSAAFKSGHTAGNLSFTLGSLWKCP